jgi:hypothetical protein
MLRKGGSRHNAQQPTKTISNRCPTTDTDDHQPMTDNRHSTISNQRQATDIKNQQPMHDNRHQQSANDAQEPAPTFSTDNQQQMPDDQY